MLTKYYLISDASNEFWYMEDHIELMGNRWTAEISLAFRYASYADAYTELEVHEFPPMLRITEIIIKE